MPRKAVISGRLWPTAPSVGALCVRYVAMTENNTEQTRSSQHRHTKKKAPTSSKKKLWKKILIGVLAFVAAAIIAIVAIFAYYGATAPTIQASD